jgi:putative ABC transport system permease protein
MRQISERVGAVPGVRSVAFTNALPMEGWGDGMPFLIAGREAVDMAHRTSCFYKRVSASYFQTLQIHLLRGRTFTDQDRAGAPSVLVINESMSKQYFKGEDPIGQRILIQQLLYGQPGLGPEIAWEVVGIVGDEQTGDLGDKKSPGIYVTYDQSPTNDVNMVVAQASDLPTSAINAAVHEVDKNQPLTDILTLDQVKSETVANDRLQTMLLTTFATLAMLLSAVGIYGVISYSVTQRTHELGIRAALGASQGGLLALVIRNGMALAFTGLALGAAGSLALTRLLSNLLFGISPRDPATLIAVGAILAAVAFAACYIPARRAAAIDPTIALRYE